MVTNNLSNKRISVFAGHYGSGKTNIAINYALMLNEIGKDVVIADLDIVNPYFRTKDSEQVLNEKGIKLISSDFASSNVDLPALPAQTYMLLDNHEIYGVIDVGGDDRGALALGRYLPGIVKENNYDIYFVINKYRPLTSNAKDCIEVMKEIEDCVNLKFTGIINNSNLGEETSVNDVLNSVQFANEVSTLSQIPIKMTCVAQQLYEELKNKIDNIMPLTLYVKQSWQKEE